MMLFLQPMQYDHYYFYKPSQGTSTKNMHYKMIMHYLKCVEHLALWYQGGDLKLRGYADVDWGSDSNGRKSTS